MTHLHMSRTEALIVKTQKKKKKNLKKRRVSGCCVPLDQRLLFFLLHRRLQGICADSATDRYPFLLVFWPPLFYPPLGPFFVFIPAASPRCIVTLSLLTIPGSSCVLCASKCLQLYEKQNRSGASEKGRNIFFFLCVRLVVCVCVLLLLSLLFLLLDINIFSFRE